MNEKLKMRLSYIFKEIERIEKSDKSFDERKIEIKQMETSLFNSLTGGGYGLETLDFRRLIRDNKDFWTKKKNGIVDAKIEWTFLKKQYLSLILKPVYNYNTKEEEIILRLLKEHTRPKRQITYYLRLYAQEYVQHLWQKYNCKTKNEMDKMFLKANNDIYNYYHKRLTQLSRAPINQVSPVCFEYLEELRRYEAIKTIKPLLLGTEKITAEEFVDSMRMGNYHYKNAK